MRTQTETVEFSKNIPIPTWAAYVSYTVHPDQTVKIVFLDEAAAETMGAAPRAHFGGGSSGYSGGSGGSGTSYSGGSGGGFSPNGKQS